MTNEEWALAYPAHKAKCLPTPEVRAAPEPFAVYLEAEREREIILTEYPEHHPHLVVVEWEGLFYLVYGKEMYRGFKEYEERPE